MITMSNEYRANPAAMEETYRDVSGLINKLAWGAVRKHGGCWDDYVSAGNEAFVLAYDTFDPDKGTVFSTWLWWKIRHAISRAAVRTVLEQHTVNTGLDIDLDALPRRERFDLRRFTCELSTDAQQVIGMAFEAAEDISEAMHHEDAGSVVRGGLQHRLRNLGWTVARILESFSEIRRALR